MSVWRNIKARGLKDLFSIRKIRNFLRYWNYKLSGLSYPELLIPEYVEQIAQRMSHVECRQCLKDGECHICHCPAPELFYEKDFVCEGGNFVEMLPPDEWKEMNVPVNPDYVKQVEEFGKILKF